MFTVELANKCLAFTTSSPAKNACAPFAVDVVLYFSGSGSGGGVVVSGASALSREGRAYQGGKLVALATHSKFERHALVVRQSCPGEDTHATHVDSLQCEISHVSTSSSDPQLSIVARPIS